MMMNSRKKIIDVQYGYENTLVVLNISGLILKLKTSTINSAIKFTLKSHIPITVK